MTDPAPRRRAPMRPPAGVATAGAAGLAFAGVLGALTLQMRAGHDPALGAGRPVAVASVQRAAAIAPRQVIVRRVVRKVVVDVVRDPAPSAASAAPGAPAAPAAPVAAAAPVATAAPVRVATAAPVAAAPAPVAAPAPAPAPAPVVTRAS